MTKRRRVRDPVDMLELLVLPITLLAALIDRLLPKRRKPKEHHKK